MKGSISVLRTNLAKDGTSHVLAQAFVLDSNGGYWYYCNTTVYPHNCCVFDSPCPRAKLGMIRHGMQFQFDCSSILSLRQSQIGTIRRYPDHGTVPKALHLCLPRIHLVLAWGQKKRKRKNY